MLIDHAQKIAYVKIPKMASTTWETIMANNTLNGGKVPDRIMKGKLRVDKILIKGTVISKPITFFSRHLLMTLAWSYVS